MAWLETVTKDGKKYLRVGFKLPGHSGKFREPLGLEDNRRNRALAREQVQKAIDREIATGNFDYAMLSRQPASQTPRIADGRADHARRIRREGLVGRATREPDQALNPSFVHGHLSHAHQNGENRRDAAPGGQGTRHQRLQA